jgi:phosphonate transport system permease protein
LRWRLAAGGSLPAGRVVAGADGSFRAEVAVRPILGRQAAAIPLEAEGRAASGPARASPALATTVVLLVQTLLMALLATTFGAALALPLGLAAARNLRLGGRRGVALYGGVRSLLNGLRAIEPLILVILFARWVGVGTAFPGLLALTVVTVASLGKLFSEAVEDAEPGPIEALRATGARRLPVIAYAVLPQVLLALVAYGIYHWDINVRMSTVVGFVGGGGIGRQLQEWIATLQWHNVAVAILGIVAVVSLMDFLSARLRQQLAAGARSQPGRDPGPTL